MQELYNKYKTKVQEKIHILLWDIEEIKRIVSKKPETEDEEIYHKNLSAMIPIVEQKISSINMMSEAISKNFYQGTLTEFWVNQMKSFLDEIK